MPGQAYEDGMGFIQFYFGLPLAMVLLSAFALPIYYKLKVYTAYEYLETRFDRKTRQLTASLFLISRGLGAGISIYAPAIVLSTVLGWPLQLTCMGMGGAVILYTVSGGARAVNRTQTLQMTVMLGGMALAAWFIARSLPIGAHDTLTLAGALGKTKWIDFSPRFDTRYTFWAGITGGLFVQLAYFGTDQSQVQRYLSGASLKESRLGLTFNAVVKLPMQAMILFVGVMVLVFYQFQPAPLFFDRVSWEKTAAAHPAEARALESDWQGATSVQRARVSQFLAAPSAITRHGLESSAARSTEIRKQAQKLVGPSVKDADYIFISFVLAHFPAGLVGLLLAVILCAAMSATAAALSSLGSTAAVDFYKRSYKPEASDAELTRAARWLTVLWGTLAVLFATFAAQLDNLIQAVNILGSIFYGPMLGVFAAGFFLRRVRATPVFWAMAIAQIAVVSVFALSSIGFLWFNVIGCAAVLVLASIFSAVRPSA
jgi:Na+/proline symporter